MIVLSSRPHAHQCIVDFLHHTYHNRMLRLVRFRILHTLLRSSKYVPCRPKVAGICLTHGFIDCIRAVDAVQLHIHFQVPHQCRVHAIRWQALDGAGAGGGRIVHRAVALTLHLERRCRTEKLIVLDCLANRRDLHFQQHISALSHVHIDEVDGTTAPVSWQHSGVLTSIYLSYFHVFLACLHRQSNVTQGYSLLNTNGSTKRICDHVVGLDIREVAFRGVRNGLHVLAVVIRSETEHKQ
mmetsp:Transcript_25455/g.42468  ORF Transcript_25455/g.42468 Transcript_25455/m.42468 type:complete len:240 (+) Transcript_25455:301-1020(+)